MASPGDYYNTGPPQRDDFGAGPPLPPRDDFSMGPGPGRAAERLKGPGIFLIVSAVLNLLMGLLLLLTCLFYAQMSPDDFDRIVWRQQPPENQKAFQDMGWTPETLRQIVVTWTGWPGGVALVASLLTLLGSILMLTRKGYGLAVLGAILACLPAVSPTGCCGVGQGAGIWALVVLFNADVRATFR
jgi:uncharacterized membrane protein YphA (DoxX/SURF4 family)